MSTTRHARGEVVRPVTLVPTKFQHCPFFFHPSADHPPVRVSLSAVTCTSHLLPECVQILATSWSFHLCCYLSCCPVCVLLIYRCSHVSVCNHFCTGSGVPASWDNHNHVTSFTGTLAIQRLSCALPVSGQTQRPLIMCHCGTKILVHYNKSMSTCLG
jgi:hypothetical protein